jgi:hypothetical protein
LERFSQLRAGDNSSDALCRQPREGSRCRSGKPTRNRPPGRFPSFAAQPAATGLAAASRRNAAQCVGVRRGSSSPGGRSAARTTSRQTWRLFANRGPRLHRQWRECFVARCTRSCKPRSSDRRGRGGCLRAASLTRGAGRGAHGATWGPGAPSIRSAALPQRPQEVDGIALPGA